MNESKKILIGLIIGTCLFFSFSVPAYAETSTSSITKPRKAPLLKGEINLPDKPPFIEKKNTDKNLLGTTDVIQNENNLSKNNIVTTANLGSNNFLFISILIGNLFISLFALYVSLRKK